MALTEPLGLGLEALKLVWNNAEIQHNLINKKSLRHCSGFLRSCILLYTTVSYCTVQSCLQLHWLLLNGDSAQILFVAIGSHYTICSPSIYVRSSVHEIVGKLHTFDGSCRGWMSSAVLNGVVIQITKYNI